MKQCVRVYIEGGAEGRAADSDFRRGWKKFFNELHELARANGFHSLEVVRGKGRGNAFRRYTKHVFEYPHDLCVLLVDAEGPVAPGQEPWDVVANRPGDQWKRPKWADKRHLYLMVQFVETWLLTDQEALRKFFKDGFITDPLPTTKLEQRSKREVEKALDAATRNSRKGPYQHGHAHEVIGLLRPERVKTLSHGKRLFEDLSKLIKGDPT